MKKEILNTDPVRYSQILLCLLGNALKFTFTGKIKLKLKYNIESHFIKVSIKDTGIGLSKNAIIQLKTLFQASQQDCIPEKISNNSSGCALGLTIASSLVRFISPLTCDFNNLEVKSEETRGSKFTFFLADKQIDENEAFNFDKPLILSQTSISHIKKKSIIHSNKTNDTEYISKRINQTELIQRSVSISLPEIDTKTIVNKNYLEGVCEKSNNLFQVFKKDYRINGSNSTNHINSDKIILIVDDDAFNLISLQMIITSLNLNYEKANNGKDAIERISGNPKICMILMDCNMPLMDGWEATEILRTMMLQGEVQNVPIIACTAYCDKESKNKCFKSGMNEIITKPISKNSIRQLFQKYKVI